MRIAQAPRDAVAPGDTATWHRGLAADGVFTDENGRTRTRAEVIAEPGPLPPGYVGPIRVTNARGVFARDASLRVTGMVDRCDNLDLLWRRR